MQTSLPLGLMDICMINNLHTLHDSQQPSVKSDLESRAKLGGECSICTGAAAANELDADTGRINLWPFCFD